LGKLGGYELNVSSDIDLVFAYPEEGQSNGKRVLNNSDYFYRLARELVKLLSEENEFGFVFRVDTRLRPWGEAGLLVQSFVMIEQYTFSIAREWERFAWIKARAITGDQEKELFSFIRPFVFRRYFDFSAFSSIRNLKRKIRQEADQKTAMISRLAMAVFVKSSSSRKVFKSFGVVVCLSYKRARHEKH